MAREPLKIGSRVLLIWPDKKIAGGRVRDCAEGRVEIIRWKGNGSLRPVRRTSYGIRILNTTGIWRTIGEILQIPADRYKGKWTGRRPPMPTRTLPYYLTRDFDEEEDR